MKTIFIVSGEKKSGKTSFLIDILSLMQINGFVVGGFVALHEIESDCYQIKDIMTNEEATLMKRVAHFNMRPNHFEFYQRGIEMGNNCIKELLIDPPDIAVVDEIGGYELEGKLWSNGFTQLIESSIPLIFTTKAKLLNRVIEKWNIKPALIFQSKDFDDPHKAFERIKKFF